MPNERRRMVTSAMNNASPSDVLKKTFWPAEVVAEEVEEEGQDFHVAEQRQNSPNLNTSVS
jgi:hypothetical protein